MSTMRRTQMYFYEDILIELKRLAKRERTTIASIVRSAIIEFLEKKNKRSWVNDPLWNIVGASSSREKDLSSNHDKYLYGAKK